MEPHFGACSDNIPTRWRTLQNCEQSGSLHGTTPWCLDRQIQGQALAGRCEKRDRWRTDCEPPTARNRSAVVAGALEHARCGQKCVQASRGAARRRALAALRVNAQDTSDENKWKLFFLKVLFSGGSSRGRLVRMLFTGNCAVILISPPFAFQCQVDSPNPHGTLVFCVTFLRDPVAFSLDASATLVVAAVDGFISPTTCRVHRH